jgi:hypothetical protein
MGTVVDGCFVLGGIEMGTVVDGCFILGGIEMDTVVDGCFILIPCDIKHPSTTVPISIPPDILFTVC